MRVTCGLVAALLLAACSSGPSEAQNQVLSVCERVQQPICAGLLACSCRLDVRGHDAAGCVAARAKTCVTALSARAVPDLEGGRVRVHEPGVARCAAALRALSETCDLGEQRGMPAECAELFVDVAAIGADCTAEGSGLLFCAAGAGVCVDPPEGGLRRCTQLPGPGEACVAGSCAAGLSCLDGTCGTRGAAGAACSTDRACAKGLACSVAGRCGAPAAEGGECAEASDCAEGLVCSAGHCARGTAADALCRLANECGAGFACARAPETRTCLDPLDAGAACEPDTCAEGLVCDENTLACAPTPGEGTPCSPGTGCSEGFTCGDDRTCHRLPGEGEACFPGDRFCAPGLGCNEATQTCAKGGGDGTACLLNPPDYVCGEGFGCDFSAAGSICRPLAGAGARCETDRTCAPDFFCAPDQRCARRQAKGTTCVHGNECARDLVCTRGSGGYSCQPIPERGQPCEFTCTAGLVCRGQGGRCAPAFCVIP